MWFHASTEMNPVKFYYIVPQELSNAINVLSIKVSSRKRKVLFINGIGEVPIKIEGKYIKGEMSNRNNLIKKRLTSAIKLYLLKADGKKSSWVICLAD